MTTTTRREVQPLTAEDMKIMDIPPNFWRASREQITAQLSDGSIPLIEGLEHYLGNWDEVWERGVGLILAGPNGIGKTCAVAWLAKEFRRYSKRVLFMPASLLWEYKMDRTLFPHNLEYTYWQWAQRVSVLIIDDFGKGMEANGNTAIMWDELLRIRLGRRLVTIITTNLDICKQDNKDGVGIDSVVKDSTWSVIKENMIPLSLTGGDRRDKKVKRNLSLVQSHE
jgi:hypothetical protein